MVPREKQLRQAAVRVYKLPHRSEATKHCNMPRKKRNAHECEFDA